LTVATRHPLLAYLLDALGMKRKAVKDLLKFGAVAVTGATVRPFESSTPAGRQS